MSNRNILVTLPSNASVDIFPENKLTCFCTKLAHPLHLEGDWSVALKEIHLPSTWLNIIDETNSLEYKISKEDGQCRGEKV